MQVVVKITQELIQRRKIIQYAKKRIVHNDRFNRSATSYLSNGVYVRILRGAMYFMKHFHLIQFLQKRFIVIMQPLYLVWRNLSTKTIILSGSLWLRD
jgi:hypothetical protein